jgi:FkbM family methyltransferase
MTPRNPKLFAAYVLAQFIRHLKNWPAVWGAYRKAAPLPSFEFRNGIILHHGPADDPVMLFHEVIIGGCYRRYLSRPLTGTLLDIGANIGITTLDFISRTPGLQIHAYEPNPVTREIFRSNIEANGLGDRVKIHSEAVGRQAGELTLRLGEHSGVASGYSASTGGREFRVPMIDLNTALKTALPGRVSLLKIEAEGAAGDILEGALPETLAQIDQVILEYHENFCPGIAQRCAGKLESAGFRCDVHAIAAEQGLLYACRA